jgi:hypothetical protein
MSLNMTTPRSSTGGDIDAWIGAAVLDRSQTRPVRPAYIQGRERHD